MPQPVRRFLSARLAATVLATVHGAASAQSVDITYAPQAAAAVPGLLTGSLLALGIAMSAIGYRTLRARGRGRLGALLLPAILTLVLATQTPLVREAAAALLPALPLTQAAGGTATATGEGSIPVTNATTARLRLVSVTPRNGRLLPGTTCAADTVLAPGGQCTVELACPIIPTARTLPQARAQGWGC